MTTAIRHSSSYCTSQPNPGALPALEIASFTLQFQTQTPIWMPTYTGSLWRGIIGTALRKHSCTTTAPTCGGCPLTANCAYHRLFQDGVNHTRGYALQPGRAGQTKVYGERQVLSVGLTLFGDELAHCDAWLKSLELVRDFPFGRNQGRIRLRRICQQHEDGRATTIYDDGWHHRPVADRLPRLPATPQRVVLRLETPLRIVKNGQVLNRDSFQGHHFLEALLKRYRLLTQQHAAQRETNTAHFETALAAVSSRVEQLATYRLERYSRNHRHRVNQDGVLGTLTFTGAGLAIWWPLLWLGQFIHVGKSAVMGFGRYQIDPNASFPHAASSPVRGKSRWATEIG